MEPQEIDKILQVEGDSYVVNQAWMGIILNSFLFHYLKLSKTGGEKVK